MRSLPLHFIVLESFLFFGVITANSQVNQSTAGLSPYLLRLERMLPDSDSCALVRRNGDYHYERLLRRKIDIFEGTLGVEDVQLLQETLSKEALRELSQDRIKEPAIHKIDDLFLSIVRDESWQNLKLFGVEGRAPYRESIEPLLNLLEKFPREKRARLSEDAGRNNCMPSENIRLAQRPKTQPNSNLDKRSLLMRVQITNKSEYELRNTCALAYEQGHYHLERWNQRLGSVNAESRIFEGSLEEQAVQQLKVLLGDPALQSRPDSLPLLNFPVLNAEMILLSMPRGDRIQQMAFWQYVGAKRGGSLYTPPHSEDGTKLVKPLKKWIDANLSAASGTELPINRASHCSISE